jgi:hypothetical protein
MSEPHLLDPPPDAARAEARAMLVDVAVILGAFLVAGVVAGVVWPQLVQPVTVSRNELGISTDEVALSHRFSNDGWYAVLAGVGGLGLGVLMATWRRTHEVVTLLVVVAGSLLAAVVSAQLGYRLGPEDPNIVLADAAVGATAQDVVRVSADVVYLVWPIAAVVGALVVLWSPPREQVGHRSGRRSR